MQEPLRSLALSRTFYMTPNGLSECQDFGAGASEGEHRHRPGDPTLVTAAALPAIIDGKYKILSLLGEGGMGTIYRAHHMLLNRDVALKTLKAGNLQPDAVGRFNREVQAVAKLDNKNVVQVFDFGLTDNNQPYYTMELLHGESLAERLERDKQLPPAEAVDIFTQVAAGLCAAHAKGIIHRDLKPANIFLQLKGGKLESAKVLDFGIAKLNNGSNSDSQNKQQLTQGGAIFGSPLYMSPEQSMGKPTDQRSDIYSFGCALYESLTGNPPYVGANAFETICMHQAAQIPRLADQGKNAGTHYPPWLDSLIAKCMTKEADSRIQSIQEILDIFAYNKSRTSTQSRNQKEKQLQQQLHNQDGKPAHSDIEADPRHPDQNIFVWLLAAASLLFVGGVVTALVIAAPKPKTTAIAGRFTSAADILHGLNETDQMPVPPAQDFDVPAGLKRFKRRAATISANNLETLANSSIVYLDMQRTVLANEALDKLARMHLEELRLGYSTLNDKGAQKLVGCKQLERLQLQSTDITDGGVIPLSNLNNMRVFDIRRTKVTDKSLEALAKLPHLEKLQVSGTKITEAGVHKLCSKCKTLRQVELANCPQISAEVIHYLRMEFPHINFIDTAKGDLRDTSSSRPDQGQIDNQ